MTTKLEQLNAIADAKHNDGDTTQLIVMATQRGDDQPILVSIYGYPDGLAGMLYRLLTEMPEDVVDRVLSKFAIEKIADRIREAKGREDADTAMAERNLSNQSLQ
jgi:hypothetical protein